MTPVASALTLMTVACASWYVAGSQRSVSSRCATALAMVFAIACALAVVGLLFAWTLWLALLAALVVRRCIRVRNDHLRCEPTAESNMWAYAAIVAVIGYAAWPSLVRPPTDGDTLIYHLPNAALWLHAHSLWATDTSYWWYPQGSELVTAAIVATCGIYTAPAVGIIASLTLGFAIFEASRAAGVGTVFSTSCALALVTTRAAIVQVGDMQNDVLLAALVLTASTDRRNVAAPLVFALAASTKPVGWLYALAAGSSRGRASKLAIAVAGASIGGWCLRDAILARGAVIPLRTGIGGSLFGTSIVGHGLAGFETLARSSLADGAATALFSSLGLIAWLHPSMRDARLAALGSALVWIASPFSFESGGVAQLAVGASLRFGLPTMAFGALMLARVVATAPIRMRTAVEAGVGLALVAFVVTNMQSFATIYAHDASSSLRVVVPAVTFVAACLFSAFRRWRPTLAIGLVTTAVTAMLVVAFDTRSLDNVAVDFADAMGEHGFEPSLPSLVLTAKSDVIITDGYPSGMVDVLRPNARMIDLPQGGNWCDLVRRLGGVIIVRENAFRRAVESPGCTLERTSAGDAVMTPAKP